MMYEFDYDCLTKYGLFLKEQCDNKVGHVVTFEACKYLEVEDRVKRDPKTQVLIDMLSGMRTDDIARMMRAYVELNDFKY